MQRWAYVKRECRPSDQPKATLLDPFERPPEPGVEDDEPTEAKSVDPATTQSPRETRVTAVAHPALGVLTVASSDV
jgi:hypothetical protein